MRFATRSIHAGEIPELGSHPVTTPIYQTSTFEWDSLDAPPHYQYTRYDNPNRTSLELILASLENGERCTCFSSGMGAIVAAFSLLKSGDGVLIASDIYGGTANFANKYLPGHGIDVAYFDACNPEVFRTAVRANTKMVVYESPTNPILKVTDVRRIATEARERGVTSLFDNTFASPYCQTPLDMGVDIVMHSTTKYIGGHSDVIGGALITRDVELGEKIYKYLKAGGSCPSPFDCWLLVRGVRTLELRMKQHCANAMGLSEFLSKHSKVKAVHYPGLKASPNHALAASQMHAFGGMFAFEPDCPPAQAMKLFEKSRLFRIAPSLGGAETLVSYPPAMSHVALNDEQLAEAGISKSLLRISTGIEDTDDLLEDLEGSLKRL